MLYSSAGEERDELYRLSSEEFWCSCYILLFIELWSMEQWLIFKGGSGLQSFLVHVQCWELERLSCY